MGKFYLLFALNFYILLSNIYAQEISENIPDYADVNRFKTIDYNYNTNISSVVINKEGFELSSPIILLNSEERIGVSFDELNAQQKDYYYTIIHCDASWKESDLLPQEYIQGFADLQITQYNYSINTLQSYTHYSFSFPNESFKITKSGNYILKVYPSGESDKVILSRRFYVIENIVSVNGKVKQATPIEQRNYQQEVDFSIDKQGFDIADVYMNLKVMITQNGRYDNAIKNIQPRLISGDILSYDYDDINIFNGGNEFRHFDIKSIRYNSDRVRKIITDSALWHIYLHPDNKRQFHVYSKDYDINGRYLIKNEDRPNSEIESDYVWVHFSLPYDYPSIEGSFYVFGGLTRWDFLPEAKMIYNYRTKSYEAKLLCKQGYYNYEYVFLRNGENIGDETIVEGNHTDTENEYFIWVYYREPGGSYDRLIGFK